MDGSLSGGFLFYIVFIIMKIVISETQFIILLNENFKKLGSGNMGSVYMKNDKIYKLTEDEDEAIVSNGLMKSNVDFKHLPKVYSVIKLGENEYGEDRYGIIRKKYTPLVNAQGLTDIIDLIKKYQKDIMYYIPNQKNDLPEEVKENKKLLNTIHGIINEFYYLI